MTTTDYQTIVAHDAGPHERRELRLRGDQLEMVRLRRSTTGGWYVRDIMAVPVDDPARWVAQTNTQES